MSDFELAFKELDRESGDLMKATREVDAILRGAEAKLKAASVGVAVGVQSPEGLRLEFRRDDNKEFRLLINSVRWPETQRLSKIQALPLLLPLIFKLTEEALLMGQAAKRAKSTIEDATAFFGHEEKGAAE